MPIIQTTKQLRPREFNDVYPTPVSHVRSALKLLPPEFSPRRILDPGAGSGVWGTEARKIYPDAYIVGSELRELQKPRAYDKWHTGDYLAKHTIAELLPAYNGDGPPGYDLIEGNPPYKFAEAFLRRSFELLADDGYMVQLLRLSFLEGQKRYAGFWREYPPMHVAVCANRPSFTGVWVEDEDTGELVFDADGKTDATSYAFFLFRKGWSGVPTLSWVMSK